MDGPSHRPSMVWFRKSALQSFSWWVWSRLLQFWLLQTRFKQRTSSSKWDLTTKTPSAECRVGFVVQLPAWWLHCQPPIRWYCYHPLFDNYWFRHPFGKLSYPIFVKKTYVYEKTHCFKFRYFSVLKRSNVGQWQHLFGTQ